MKQALKHIRHSRGVTLIELMIAVAILGILLALALPNYAIWIQNTQIRTAAESILEGMQKARVEAARRNVMVEFALGDGTAWSITVPSTGEEIETRAASDGSAKISLTVDDPPGATTVEFNSLGRVNNPDTAIKQVTLDSNAIKDTGESRKLQITVDVGGIIRMCDPNVYETGDPRKC